MLIANNGFVAIKENLSITFEMTEKKNAGVDFTVFLSHKARVDRESWRLINKLFRAVKIVLEKR